MILEFISYYKLSLSALIHKYEIYFFSQNVRTNISHNYQHLHRFHAVKYKNNHPRTLFTKFLCHFTFASVDKYLKNSKTHCKHANRPDRDSWICRFLFYSLIIYWLNVKVAVILFCVVITLVFDSNMWSNKLIETGVN